MKTGPEVLFGGVLPLNTAKIAPRIDSPQTVIIKISSINIMSPLQTKYRLD